MFQRSGRWTRDVTNRRTFVPLPALYQEAVVAPRKANRDIKLVRPREDVLPVVQMLTMVERPRQYCSSSPKQR